MELPDEALPAQRDSHLSCVRTRAAETWRVINLMRRRLSCANARVVPRHRLQHCHRVAEAQSVCLDVSAEVSTRTILADGNIAHVSRQDDLSERYAGENGTGVMHQGEFAKFHEERTFRFHTEETLRHAALVQPDTSNGASRLQLVRIRYVADADTDTKRAVAGRGSDAEFRVVFMADSKLTTGAESLGYPVELFNVKLITCLFLNAFKHVKR